MADNVCLVCDPQKSMHIVHADRVDTYATQQQQKKFRHKVSNTQSDEREGYAAERDRSDEKHKMLKHRHSMESSMNKWSAVS